MKRLVLSALLLASAFACTSSIEEGRPEPAASTSPIVELDEVTMPEETTLEIAAEPAPEPVDTDADLVPAGAFKDVASFCAAQKALAAPRIAAANERWKDEGQGDLGAAPMCRELAEVLKETSMSEFIEVKSVLVETGGGTAVYLLINGKGGWSAIRTPFMTADYNDPGCGSIERQGGITDIHEDGDVLVVTTESGRTFYKDEDDNGELTLRHARTCHAGAACAAPEVVEAKAVLRRDIDAPVVTRSFTTTYSVGPRGAIVPATAFDEAKL